MKKNEEGVMFPPWPSKCPDYWTVDSSGRCVNTHKLGICKTNPNDNVMDFNEDPFTGPDGMNNKCQWSKTCQSPWERD